MAEEELKPTIVPLTGKLITSKDPMTLGTGDFQDLTNMRYKPRNPISVLGMTKYNTATVVDGTVSPGTYMKTRQGFHFRKDTPTDFGATTEEPEEPPWEPPNLDALWAWFKFNEGTGTTIEDYSPLLEDGTVNTAFGDPTTKFWDVAGFGYNSTTESPLTWVYRVASAERICTYCSMVAFFRIDTLKAVDYTAKGYCQLGQGGTGANWLRITSGYNTPFYWCLNGGSVDDEVFATSSPIADTWYCCYAVSDGSQVGGDFKLYTRVSGEAFTLVVDSVTTDAMDETQTTVSAFGWNNGSIDMTGGDILYYSHSTSIGCITLAQANDIYDNLKTRYSMT